MDKCTWVYEDIDHYWITACARRYHFEDGTPSDNKVTLCPHCYKPIDEMDKCTWVYEDIDHYWTTACARRYHFEDGTPSDNKVTLCPHCYKPIKELKNADD